MNYFFIIINERNMKMDYWSKSGYFGSYDQ